MPREPKSTRIKRRTFTKDQDELIVLHSQGKITLDFLEKSTHASRETLSRRAQELGVELRTRQFGTQSQYRKHRYRKSQPDELIPAKVFYGDHGANPVNVGDDELLKRLYDEHGERRYVALQIRSKEEAT